MHLHLHLYENNIEIILYIQYISQDAWGQKIEVQVEGAKQKRGHYWLAVTCLWKDWISGTAGSMPRSSLSYFVSEFESFFV